MLNSNGFDKWAGEYDESIANSTGYPFEGYYNILGCVHDMVAVDSDTKILDIGIGTGQLTYELYKKGGKIYGIDFSAEMLRLARARMPEAVFLQFDFNNGVPEELTDIRFDYIVSSYAIHHIDDNQKIMFIKELKNILKSTGVIILADVAFKTKDDMLKCKAASSGWDDDEIYMIFDDIGPELEKEGFAVDYSQLSSCGGILKISLQTSR